MKFPGPTRGKSTKTLPCELSIEYCNFDFLYSSNWQTFRAILRVSSVSWSRYYERRYSQLGHKMVASWSLNLLPKWQQPWSWGLGCKSEQKSSKGWPRQWGHFWPHKVTFVPTDWCVLVLIHVHLNFWRVNFQELTPRMQKCPKMSIVVTPAVGSLLTEPPGNHFIPQLAVPSFIVPSFIVPGVTQPCG